MARVFRRKRGRINPRTGKRESVPSKCWYGEFRDADGLLRTVKLFTDKQASQGRAVELEREALRNDQFATHRRRPLATHVDDFERHLAAKANAAKYVRMTANRLRAIFTGCRITKLSELSASAVTDWLAQQRQPKADEKGETEPGMAVHTSNEYLTAAKSFGNWLVKDRRIAANPFAHLSALNAATDVRRERRPLEGDELARLIDATRRSPVVFRGLDGERRALLYLVAVSTGLRAAELASLTAASFDLDGDPATVTVEAGYSKHRRRDVLPLRQDVAAVLRPVLAADESPDGPRIARPGKQGRGVNQSPADASTGQLWPGKWISHSARMLRGDLDAAGIAHVDDAGRVLDFHALRHSFISDLARAGVHPKEAQALARHSSIGLTMDRYTHLGIVDTARAVERLPAMPWNPINEAATLRATGTTDTSREPSKKWTGKWTGPHAISEHSMASDGPGEPHKTAERENEKTPAKPGFSAANQADGARFERAVPLRAQQFSRLPP